jgi:DNA replication licensing factor MCM7
MRSYIAYAQTFNPTIPAELHNYIVARYVEKRKFQREGKEELSYTYITPRTLLAIIRISQAMAKFHFRDSVNQKDVDSAIGLIDFSFKTLEDMNAGKNSRKNRHKKEEYQDTMSAVIDDLRAIMKRSDKKQMNLAEIIKKCQH